MSIYQFAFHERVSTTPPRWGSADKYHEKLSNQESLTREEKDELGRMMYGTFGAGSCVLKYAGWAWSFAEFLPLYLVRQYGQWHEYRAPDKTSLRKNLYGRIEKIVLAEAV